MIGKQTRFKCHPSEETITVTHYVELQEYIQHGPGYSQRSLQEQEIWWYPACAVLSGMACPHCNTLNSRGDKGLDTALELISGLKQLSSLRNVHELGKSWSQRHKSARNIPTIRDVELLTFRSPMEFLLPFLISGIFGCRDEIELCDRDDAVDGLRKCLDSS